MMLKAFFLAAGILVLASGRLGTAAGVTASSAAASAAEATPSQTLLTISCPTVSVCYAGGNHGTLLATHDGGAMWQSQSWQGEYRMSATTIVSIACPAAGSCFALTQAGCDELGAHVPFLHTTDDGNHWGTTSIQGCGSSLACPDVSTCYTAVFPTGEGLPAFMRTTDGGRSWQKRATINASGVHESLACPTSTVCYVAYQNTLGRSTDSGKRWSISRVTGKPCVPLQSGCPGFYAIACPEQSTCYAGGGVLQNGRGGADVITTDNGFRSRTSHLIPDLDNVIALSCPTQSVCFALGNPYASRAAVTRDAGKRWHVVRITAPYLFNALACTSVSVCYAAGFLGRLVGTKDGGATWHDLLPAIFVSGTYGARQPLHTYSGWFSATGPGQVAVSKLAGPGAVKPGGRPLASGCRATGSVVIYVRNAQGQTVAGPILGPCNLDGSATRRTVQVTGKLRLDVVSHCSSFSVRVDGVEPSTGGR